MFGDFIHPKNAFAVYESYKGMKIKMKFLKKWLQISQAFLHYFNAMVSQTLHGELEKKKKGSSSWIHLPEG